MPDYGTDIYCRGDLRRDMPTATGLVLLLNSLANRLETAPGTLAWDPQGADYGYDVRALVNAKIRDANKIGRRVADELEKDDRVDSAEVAVTFLDGSLELKCQVVAEEVGPFAFTLAVSELTVTVLTEL